MKIIYIAHPVGGNITHNLEEIRKITRRLNVTRSDIVPFVPYWIDCHALDDSVPSERARGIKNNTALFHSGVIHEVWLYGNTISTGMRAEVALAISLKIPVIPQTPETERALRLLFRDYPLQLQKAS